MSSPEQMVNVRSMVDEDLAGNVVELFLPAS